MSDGTLYVDGKPVGEVKDIQIQMSANVARFNEAMAGVTQVMRRMAFEFSVAARKLRAFARYWLRRHRSGHRHRGTRDWQLRYAPARKDVPLGQRTLAKRHSVQAV